MQIIVKGEVVEVPPLTSVMNLEGVVVPPELLVKLKKVNQERLFIGWGVRCYNGAFDSKTSAVFNYQDQVFKWIKEAVPNINITYFPMEGFYSGGQNYRSCTKEHSTRGGAICDLLDQIVVHAEKGES